MAYQIMAVASLLLEPKDQLVKQTPNYKHFLYIFNKSQLQHNYKFSLSFRPSYKIYMEALLSPPLAN